MLIKREEYLNKIRPFYDIDIVKVLIGSRRSGKSKMIELIINELRFRLFSIKQKQMNYLYFNEENNEEKKGRGR